MKRAGNLYYSIPGYENLRLAFWKAAKGKRDRSEVISFIKDFDNNIKKLKDQLLNRNLDIGHYYFFKVHDPKPRSICAASFPERVLHHAIMNVCEPILDSYAIHDSYACRKGKGTHRAKKKAQTYTREYNWYLKLDIRKYFDSIDHFIMIRLLSRRIKDMELILLFQRLLDTYQTETGKGMPIGNLISQHLANFYLGYFDHWVKEIRKVKPYIRYMDDFILFGHDKAYLKNELEEIKLFLATELELELKHNIQLNRCARGVPFLGFRIFEGKIDLSPRSRQRFVQKFRQYERKLSHGEWSEETLSCHMLPLVEFTRAGNTNGFRRSVIERFGFSS